MVARSVATKTNTVTLSLEYHYTSGICLVRLRGGGTRIQLLDFYQGGVSLHRRREVPNLEIFDTNIALQIRVEVSLCPVSHPKLGINPNW